MMDKMLEAMVVAVLVVSGWIFSAGTAIKRCGTKVNGWLGACSDNVVFAVGYVLAVLILLCDRVTCRFNFSGFRQHMTEVLAKGFKSGQEQKVKVAAWKSRYDKRQPLAPKFMDRIYDPNGVLRGIVRILLWRDGMDITELYQLDNGEYLALSYHDFDYYRNGKDYWSRSMYTKEELRKNYFKNNMYPHGVKVFVQTLGIVTGEA